MILEAVFLEEKQLQADFGVLAKVGSGVKIDDNAVGQDAWSSANIVDKVGIVAQASGSTISLKDSSALPLQGLTLYGTEDTASVESVTVNVGGKNLRSISDLVPTINSAAKATKTDTGIIVGNTTGGGGTYLLYNLFLISAFDGKSITFSAKYKGVTGACKVVFGYSNADASIRRQIISKGPSSAEGNVVATFNVDSNSEKAKDCEYICIWLYNQVTGNLEHSDIQIELGTTATAYEPYKEPQTLVVSVPNALDNNGFVCEDFAQLHTYKPTTIITNDVGAEMKVEYVADTKAYIDNKLAELATAIVNNA